MNVSISRAKEALFIVGNMNILQKQKAWKDLIDILKTNEYKNSILNFREYKYEPIEIIKNDYNRIHKNENNIINNLKENEKNLKDNNRE